jgi:hypothetical protein
LQFFLLFIFLFLPKKRRGFLGFLTPSDMI